MVFLRHLVAGVVGAKPYFEPVVHIEPFGVVVHLFHGDAGPYHEGQASAEVGKKKLAVQLAFGGDGPILHATKLGVSGLAQGHQQLDHQAERAAGLMDLVHRSGDAAVAVRVVKRHGARQTGMTDEGRYGSEGIENPRQAE